MSNDNYDLNRNELISDIRNIIEHGRESAYSFVGNIMIETYWQIGRRIVEEEQQGRERSAPVFRTAGGSAEIRADPRVCRQAPGPGDAGGAF